MRTSGPWVAAALFCERVLNETDGVLSAIRIIDNITVNKASLSEADKATDRPPIIELSGLVSLRADEAAGTTHDVSIEGFYPSGTPLDPPRFDYAAPFTTPDSGVNVIISLRVTVRETGTYWFTVRVGGEVATRIPLTLVIVETTPDSSKDS
jgi:hypothetical protein